MRDVEGDTHVPAIWSNAWLSAFEAGDQGALYAENGIPVEVGICLLEDVRCKRFVSRRRDHEVHVRGTHRATVRGVKQLAYWSILGNWIGRRFDGPEEVFPSASELR